MLLILAELIAFLAAFKAIDLARGFAVFTDILPPLPVLGYAYLKFTVAMGLLAWLRLRGARLAAFGFREFGPVWLFGVVAASAVVASVVVPSLLAPLLAGTFGQTRDLSAFAPLVGHPAALLWILPGVWLFAAFGEEFVYRGYIQGTVQILLGGGRTAVAAAILVQAILFALAHAYQGVAGMIPIGLCAIVYGALYWAGGQRLWPMILAHGLVDTIGMVAISADAMTS